MLEATIAVVGVALTFGLFHLISVSWPRLYYGPSDGLAIFLSSSLIKFTLFRVLPVALVTSVASAYAIKVEADALLLSILYFIVYVLGLSVFRFVSRYRFGRRVSLRDVMWLLVASGFTLLGTTAGWISSSYVEALLPKLSVSRDALFTALLVAVVIRFMQRIMLDEDISEIAIRRAIADCRLLVASVEAEARRKGIARWLISSIVVAEHMQRPKWFRSLEDMVYAVGVPVTVGPFQGHRQGRGNIREQVAEFMRTSPAAEFAAQVKLGGEWYGEGAELATYALHNDADPFVNLCRQVRELLIEAEFDAAATPHELDSLGIEFGPVRLRSSAVQKFSFEVHLRSDAEQSVSFLLCRLEELSSAASKILAPGETFELHAYASEVDAEWVFRAADVCIADVEFRPIRDLEFKVSWEG